MGFIVQTRSRCTNLVLFAFFLICQLYQRGEFTHFFCFAFVGGWWYPWIEASGQHKYSNSAQHNTSVVNLWYLIVPLGLNPGHLRGHILVHSHGSGLISGL